MPSSAGFDLDGDDDLGVVLIHGFTGTPFELRFLGEALARDGFTVRAPLLPGHGTTPADLDRTTWRDWAACVEDAATSLRGRCARVAVIGQSLGGLLALHLASQRDDLAAVGSLAAPLWLPPLAGRIAASTQRGLLRGLRAIPKLGGSDVRDRRVRAENPCYDRIPTRALGHLLAFMRITDDALPRVTAPLIVLHAAHDHTAPVACAARIAARARAVRVRVLPRSYHLIAADVERDLVAAELSTFLRRHARRVPPPPPSPSPEPPCAT